MNLHFLGTKKNKEMSSYNELLRYERTWRKEWEVNTEFLRENLKKDFWHTRRWLDNIIIDN